MKKLAVIGMGNMGEAIVAGLSNLEIVAREKDFGRATEMEAKYHFPCQASLEEVADCDAILLAVKPQQFGELLPKLGDTVSSKNLLISIAAGITTETMDDLLGGRGRLIRVMPNTPVFVQQGMSAICPGPRATEKDLAEVEQLFSAIGDTIIIDEQEMDVVSALSGSGPAYFFYLIEALAAAGVAQGLDPKKSLQLSLAACEGAAALLNQSEEPPHTLRQNVTSPGGSTAAAIALFDKANMNETIQEAIAAAIERNRQLGEIS